MAGGRLGRGRLRGPAVSPQTLGLLSAVTILVVGATAPGPPGLSPDARMASGVFLATLVLWLTRPIPYVVSSVLGVTLLYALGVTESFSAAASGFASSLVPFLLLLFLLGDAVATVDLDEYVARRLLSPGDGPASAFRSLATSLLAVALVMPSATARAITFGPIVTHLASRFGFGEESSFERAGFLLLGHVNPIASMALMTGGGMALVTSGILSRSVRPITWVEWAVLMVPPTVCLYVLGTVAVAVLGGADAFPATEQRPTAAAPGREPPPALTREQRVVGVVLCGAMVGWVVGSFLGVPPVLPAAVAVTALAVPGVGVVDREAIREVNWGIVFLIGAMLSILEVLERTGAFEYVVAVLTRHVPFEALAHWQVVGVLLGIAVGIRVAFSTASAAMVVTLPVVLEFGAVAGVSRLYLGLAVLLVVGSTTVFPFNTTAVLVSTNRGPVSHRDVVTYGLVMLALSVVVVAVSWLVYWPAVQ